MIYKGKQYFLHTQQLIALFFIFASKNTSNSDIWTVEGLLTDEKRWVYSLVGTLCATGFAGPVGGMLPACPSSEHIDSLVQ